VAYFLGHPVQERAITLTDHSLTSNIANNIRIYLPRSEQPEREKHKQNSAKVTRRKMHAMFTEHET